MTKQGKIRIVRFPVDSDPFVVEIDNTLEALQGQVEGLIEPVALGRGLSLVLNEEALLIGMEPNRALVDRNGKARVTIAGPFFVTVDDETDDEGNFRSLTDEEIARVMRMATRHPKAIMFEVA